MVTRTGEEMYKYYLAENGEEEEKEDNLSNEKLLNLYQSILRDKKSLLSPNNRLVQDFLVEMFRNIDVKIIYEILQEQLKLVELVPQDVLAVFVAEIRDLYKDFEVADLKKIVAQWVKTIIESAYDENDPRKFQLLNSKAGRYWLYRELFWILGYEVT